MKVKKWLTIITLVISVLSLTASIIIGKSSESIFYDITMAIFGGAILSFIMSLTEYFVEKRKAMEEFWHQATIILNKLRKIKYLDVDAPVDLILAVYEEEHSNHWNRILSELSEDKSIKSKAKNDLISWLEKNKSVSFDENTDINEKLEKYKGNFRKCMESYKEASLIELGALDNAYGNLDFIFINKTLRKNIYESIYDKLRNIVCRCKSETFHFNQLAEGKDNWSVCATKINDLNKDYFIEEKEIVHGFTNTLIYQSVFDEIDASLEKFRCKIYRIKYKELEKIPISGNMQFFGE